MNERVMRWFEARGISASTLSAAFVYWDTDKKAIAIPVKRPDGSWFNKYRRDPDRHTGMKYWADAGGSRSLYLSQDLVSARTVYVVEGELDALRVKSAGHKAVSSTTGASNWDEEWTPLFRNKVVYVWYDADETGERGGASAARSIAREAAIVYLVRHDPSLGKDVTDVLTRLGDGILKDDALRLGKVDGITARIVAREPAPAPKPRTQPDAAVPRPPLSAVLEKYGVVLRGRLAKCPLHDDRSPSFSVSEEKGLWYCHAGCGGGDVYTLVEKLEKCGFKEAKKIIEKIC